MGHWRSGSSSGAEGSGSGAAAAAQGVAAAAQQEEGNSGGSGNIGGGSGSIGRGSGSGSGDVGGGGSGGSRSSGAAALAAAQRAVVQRQRHLRLEASPTELVHRCLCVDIEGEGRAGSRLRAIAREKNQVTKAIVLAALIAGRRRGSFLGKQPSSIDGIIRTSWRWAIAHFVTLGH